MLMDPSVVASALAGLAALYVVANYLWPSKRSVGPTLFLDVPMN